LSRAEHRRGGRIKARGLFERSEFPRAPAAASTRREKRDTGVFFRFVFFHVEENEETIYVKTPRIGITAPDPPPKMEGLDQN
jgi:hypothetical protein